MSEYEYTYNRGGSTSANVLVNCPYCGNWHTGICSRVKAIEYHPNGQVKRVEFHEPVTVTVGATGDIEWVNPAEDAQK